jgi:hypothetical protein
MRSTWIALIGMSVWILSASSSDASVLYGLSFDLSELYSLNQSNGAGTPIGLTLPRNSLRDLASDTRADSFRIWANDYQAGQLRLVSPSTGATTLVGPFGLPSGTFIRTLGFDAVNSKLYGTSDVPSSLYEINANTGAATLVGPLGLTGVGGIGADNAGDLYAVDETTHGIYRLNKSTGAATLTATVSFLNMSDIAFRPEDDALFIGTYDSLYSVNPQTGAAINLGTSGQGVTTMSGIAFGPAVPEPGVGLSVAAGLAVFARRRYLRRC